MKWRIVVLCSMMVMLMITSSGSAQIVFPESSAFSDAMDDVILTKFIQTGVIEGSNIVQGYYLEENATDATYADIISIGYQLNRNNQSVDLTMETQTQPIVNRSVYYTMSMEFSNDSNSVLMRTYFGAIGKPGPDASDQLLEGHNTTRYDITFQGRAFFNVQENITTLARDGNVISWKLQNNENITEIDIVSIFDDPSWELVEIAGAIEYTINGSSSFGSNGDYLSDELKIENPTFGKNPVTFSIPGGTQTNTQGTGTSPTTTSNVLEDTSPLATGLYFGIPVLFLSWKALKRAFGDFESFDE